MNKALYAKAKEYADTNTKGSKLELKCLAEMLYEFAEKEIKLLSERCNQLLKDKGELIDQVTKMRCCGNCRGVCNSDDAAYFCKDNNYKLWEIRE